MNACLMKYCPDTYGMQILKLNSAKALIQMDLILTDDSITPVHLAKEITNLLLDNAKTCNLKSTKKGNKIKKDKAWFDKECEKQKKIK